MQNYIQNINTIQLEETTRRMSTRGLAAFLCQFYCEGKCLQPVLELMQITNIISADSGKDLLASHYFKEFYIFFLSSCHLVVVVGSRACCLILNNLLKVIESDTLHP